MNNIEEVISSLLKDDQWLTPYKNIIKERLLYINYKTQKLLNKTSSLFEFAMGHYYFGLHLHDDEWILREWAPNATAIYLIGEMTNWEEDEKFVFKRLDKNGEWEIRLPKNTLCHKALYRLRVYWPGEKGDRIPSYSMRVVQDPDTLIFNAQVWHPDKEYVWENNFCPSQKNSSIFIYESHVGMAQQDGKVGTYKEFTKNIIPRIVKAGYNVIQLMAIQEHPYYASFGYHVSNFFAASSRFGTPEDLKELIDTAHENGLIVIMDLVHSHAVCNEIEGLSRFDGSLYQYFHAGERGLHKAWDSRCFDYGKDNVIHFLLSNCRFWLEEYHVDGFRFDGITSMLYKHHGLEASFTSYDDYFNDSIDVDAFLYLTLANKLIHQINSNAITIAEDVSGMPGLCIPISKGGIGFDYRFAMGIPDYWIRLFKQRPDEKWHVGEIWYELTNKRKEEKTISYAESHDQALVGDKTIIFRLIDSDMYEHMSIKDKNIKVNRGIALHKMIRLITMSTAGDGYLNFMGNEFGHPEWIDFPRKENQWSYNYARRQWNLLDNPDLKYQFLACFDKDMIKIAKKFKIFDSTPEFLFENCDDQVIVFKRNKLVFIFNFNPLISHTDYCVKVLPGKYRLIFESDSSIYGGQARLANDQIYYSLKDTLNEDNSFFIKTYLPTRTALVMVHEN